MLNDKDTSELISRSLSGIISLEQQAAVEEQIQQNENTRRFAKLSSLIQRSLSDVGRQTEKDDLTESTAPGLSEAARQRLKKSLSAESAALSRTGSDPALQATIKPGSRISDAASSGLSSSLPDYQERSVRSRYTLLRKIGAGGLGTVWLARDEKLKRSVALKEMNPDAAELPRAWRRFHREAEITGHLEHPNVVPLYHFGTDEITGQPFYAMRFVGKRTLVDAIEAYHDRREAGENVTMDLHHLLTAFIGVCQAIAYANSRGVIHRDLKPENVALDSFGQVVVLDWGLAKVSSDYDGEGLLSGDPLDPNSSPGDTVAGEVIGTPLYMAPEQAAGLLDDIDNRTDIYGLGAILFAMLTGHAPHENSSVAADQKSAVPVGDMLQSIANNPSPLPRDYGCDIPADLEAICAKAMKFKAHSRYQSAEDMATAIQTWMAGRSERLQKYTHGRSEARELRTAMLAAVRDVERNARFMSRLPPIQGIVNAVSGREGDEMSVWRERLAVIYTGLLQTNSDFLSVRYVKVEDDNFQELIRIDRQISDPSNVRSIPLSRLLSGPRIPCMEEALAGTPDEVYVAMSTECGNALPAGNNVSGRMAATVPVFDDFTEDVFGLVMIEAGLDQLVEHQIRGRFRDINQLYVLDNESRIIMQVDRSGSRARNNDGKSMFDMHPDWQTVVDQLQSEGEFVDENDYSFYAVPVELVPGRYSLTLALCLKDQG